MPAHRTLARAVYRCLSSAASSRVAVFTAIGTEGLVFSMKGARILEAMLAMCLLMFELVTLRSADMQSAFFSLWACLGIILVFLRLCVAMCYYRLFTRNTASSSSQRDRALALVEALWQPQARRLHRTSAFLTLVYAASIVWTWVEYYYPCLMEGEKIHGEACAGYFSSFTRLAMASSVFLMCSGYGEGEILRLFLPEVEEQSCPEAKQGLSQEQLETLSSHFLDPKNAREHFCYICLEAPTVDELVCQLPCGHLFHKECVHCWLKRTAACPLRCEADVLGTPCTSAISV
eukprot:TRINITY_DN95951_c0_g1_i1.p1 TRINITY_DN95951_c0_g1~~TRINITY_DN95951_c0_g1_i1.p1  ORF type:complete len:290 (-),score=35.55 TRINITY_DN95951_c0_g1_i1:43-912(-)